MTCVPAQQHAQTSTKSRELGVLRGCVQIPLYFLLSSLLKQTSLLMSESTYMRVEICRSLEYGHEDRISKAWPRNTGLESGSI